MKPGIELDILIAEKVMEYKVIEWRGHYEMYDPKEENGYDPIKDILTPIPPYSSHISAA